MMGTRRDYVYLATWGLVMACLAVGGIVAATPRPPTPQKFYLHGPLLKDHNGCETPALVVYGTDKLDALRAAGLQIDDVLEYRDGGEATAAACQKRITK